MMYRALLLDLDDTLLVNSVDRFIPAYFRALTDFVGDRIPSQLLIHELLRATRAMDEGDGRSLTNEEAFVAVFYPALGQERNVLDPVFRRFYEEVFPSLRELTRPIAEAPEVVGRALRAGLDVVVATNPLFPATAIEQRLEWAGLPPAELGFALITSYENMHATKARPAYYREIADRIGRSPGECLMVGDNWEWDVVHAVDAGVDAFWIADPKLPPPDPSVPLVGQGTLADFAGFAEGSVWPAPSA
jgi:FMN phosphatase YigB (HAD superfamily)